MEMSDKVWIDLLAQAHVPSPEVVVYTAPYRKTLRIRKGAWLQHWKGTGGLALQSGQEILLVPCDEGGAQVPLPIWTIEQLQLDKGDQLNRRSPAAPS